MNQRPTNLRVAIIGGGMSGLSLANLLGRAGWRVTVFEKDRDLGGLLAVTDVNGIPIERHYHHFFTSDTYLRDLLEELGLDKNIRWLEGSNAIYRDGHVYPSRTATDYLRLPFLSWNVKIRSAVAALQLRCRRPETLPADLTAERYLRRLFGRVGWEKMWRPMMVNKFGKQLAGRISARWIAQRIQVRTGSTHKGREVLGYLDGSFRLLFERLREAIKEQGGELVLGREVANVTRTSDGHYLINDQAYDIVVSTIAPDLLTAIAPELKLPAVSYRAVITPLYILRSPVTPHYWINILDEKIPFSVIVNQQSLLPSDYYRGRYPLYVGHYVAADSELLRKNNTELFAYYLPFLEKIFPGIAQAIEGYEFSRTLYAQPVITAPWTPLSHRTNLPNFYATSMAHIFPEDRGVNYAIREARRMCALLTDQYT